MTATFSKDDNNELYFSHAKDIKIRPSISMREAQLNNEKIDNLGLQRKEHTIKELEEFKFKYLLPDLIPTK